ncbi:PDZ domain-containing protein [Treponema pedis]|nr:PDZ domain-containing protein [Treponema pedis]
MKKYLFTAFFVFTTFVLFASEMIEIPFLYDKENKKIFVYAEIGKKKGYFMFDTGCSTSIVFDKKENYNNFKTVSNINESYYVLNLKIPDVRYSADSLILAGNKLNLKHEFNVTDEPLLVKFFPGIAGIIGLDIFKNKIFEISMTDSLIRIYNEKPDKYMISTSVFIDDFKEHYRITIPLKSNGKTYKAMIDTGSIKTGLSEDSHDVKINSNVKIKVFNPTAHPYKKDYYAVKRTIEFMGLKFENKIFETLSIDDMNIDIIGMDILLYFDMLFDLRDNENPLFYYKQRIPSEYFNLFIDSHIENKLRISILFDENNYGFIERLIEHSSAWNAGLRPGSIITKINSRPVLEYSINDIKRLTNTAFKITYIDPNGKEKTVKIKPKKML